MSLLSKEDRDKLLLDMWRGAVTVVNLPELLYVKTYESFIKKLDQGFGKGIADIEIETPAWELNNKMRGNLNYFSSARVYQYVNDNQNIILDDKGFIRPFNEFKKDALKIDEKYNKNWLKTEHDMTIKQANSAARWDEIQENKESLPYLQFQTAKDERVRSSHSAFDGIVKPVGSAFWNTHTPPLEWGCRCDLIQLDAIDGKRIGKLQDIDTEDGKWVRKTTTGTEQLPTTSGAFQQNVGKTGQVFKSEGNNIHPYFKAPQKLKDNNFGLPKLD